MEGDKVRVERRRGPMGDGKPRNQELRDAILEKARAELVVRYRKHPQAWPDGIDHAGNRWYGDGSGWTDERIEAGLHNPIFLDPADRPKGKPKLIGAEGAPWIALGVSRATYFRRNAMVKAASGDKSNESNA